MRSAPTKRPRMPYKTIITRQSIKMPALQTLITPHNPKHNPCNHSHYPLDLRTTKYSIPSKTLSLHSGRKKPGWIGETYRFPRRPGKGGGTGGLPYASTPRAARQSGQYHFALREGMSDLVMCMHSRWNHSLSHCGRLAEVARGSRLRAGDGDLRCYRRISFRRS
jgi:hypothetical protein